METTKGTVGPLLYDTHINGTCGTSTTPKRKPHVQGIGFGALGKREVTGAKTAETDGTLRRGGGP